MLRFYQLAAPAPPAPPAPPAAPATPATPAPPPPLAAEVAAEIAPTIPATDTPPPEDPDEASADMLVASLVHMAGIAAPATPPLPDALPELTATDPCPDEELDATTVLPDEMELGGPIPVLFMSKPLSCLDGCLYYNISPAHHQNCLVNRE